jgi:hypothetical protein
MTFEPHTGVVIVCNQKVFLLLQNGAFQLQLKGSEIIEVSQMIFCMPFFDILKPFSQLKMLKITVKVHSFPGYEAMYTLTCTSFTDYNKSQQFLQVMKRFAENLTSWLIIISVYLKTKLNSMAVVCKRTIPTERPLLVGEVSANLCG